MEFQVEIAVVLVVILVLSVAISLMSDILNPLFVLDNKLCSNVKNGVIGFEIVEFPHKTDVFILLEYVIVE